MVCHHGPTTSSPEDPPRSRRRPSTILRPARPRRAGQLPLPRHECLIDGGMGPAPTIPSLRRRHIVVCRGGQHRAALTSRRPPASSSTGWPSTAHRRTSPSAPPHRQASPRAAPQKSGASRPPPSPPPPTSGRTEPLKTLVAHVLPLPQSADRPRSPMTPIDQPRRTPARARLGPPRAGATRPHPPSTPPTSASGRERYRTTPRTQRASSPVHLAPRPHPTIA